MKTSFLIHDTELPGIVTELVREAVREIKLEHQDPDQSMTTKEAAEFLRVHPNQIRIYREAGLPSFRQGKEYTYRRHDLIEWREKFRTVHESRKKRVA